MADTNESPLDPSALARLTGDERFSTGDSVLDFWRWALGDLRMNNARGYLVEYLVARAVGATARGRVEWAGWDVEAPGGTRIEVKSSGYLQSWRQQRVTQPRFSLAGLHSTQVWNDDEGRYVVVREGHVQVWVFALHTCKAPDLYDPLDIGAWRFWAVPQSTLAALGQKSAGLATIERLARDVSLDRLPAAVASARRVHDRTRGGSPRPRSG